MCEISLLAGKYFMAVFLCEERKMAGKESSKRKLISNKMKYSRSMDFGSIFTEKVLERLAEELS